MAEIRSNGEQSLARRSPRREGWLARDSLPRRVAPALLGFLLLWMLLLAAVIETAHFAATAG